MHAAAALVPAPSGPSPTRRHPARAWAAATAVALAGHAWLLADGRDGSAWRRANGNAAPPRTVVLLAATPTPSRVDPTLAAPATPRRPPATIVPRAHRPVAPPPVPRADDAVAALDAAAAAAGEPLRGTAAATDPGEAPPVYRTQLPPPFTMRFEWQRGRLAGEGELRFDIDPTGYRLQWQTRGQGRGDLGLASQGQAGPQGLAPERHAELRRGRERQAAHFDRDGARITYSGPSVVNELQRGAQDRLSWLVQLPAIVTADPVAFGAGARVRVQVSGVRGDAGLWQFVVLGDEDVIDAGGQEIRALRLLREPSRPYDTRAEIWLDPARHHLPVRVRLTHPPSNEGLDWRRASLAPVSAGS